MVGIEYQIILKTIMKNYIMRKLNLIRLKRHEEICKITDGRRD